MSAITVVGVNRSGRHGLTVVVLHWALALLIIGMLLLGFYMVGIPKGTPGRAFYFNLHKSLGVLAGMLILLRLGWRLRHAAAPLPAGMPGWRAVAARWSHRLLYLCMVLQPATGYLSSSFNKYGIKLFGAALPNWAWEDPRMRDLFMGFHKTIAVVFAVLIAVHVLAALKHLLVDRDRVFQRMLP
jgi:cytochrome b561